VLVAQGHLAIGRAEQHWVLCFAPRFWISIVRRSGLVLDTRFVAPAADAPSAMTCLYLLQSGRWTLHDREGGPLEAPCAFVVSEEDLEGRRGARPFTFSARGEPYRSIEIHVANEDWPRAPAATPARLDLPSASWRRAEAVQQRAAGGDAACREVVGELLRGLAAAGVLASGAVERALRRVPRRHALLWVALRPMIEKLYPTPTLQEVAGTMGLSTRQVDRYVEDFVGAFGLVGERWRSSTLHLRLKLAVILLSADDASVAEVARVIGYSSADAMARAFRDAGLPPPAAVQRNVREARIG
jgi:AraC-like DNA-binding protein